jgi:MurNAc alpha-1-phosphate uridylyltransferase
MVLAAGRGERMRPLTDHTPKPLLSVGGKTLIERHIEKLAMAGFTRLVVNHAHLGKQIESALGDGSRWNISITFSREQVALETAGGICNALGLINAEAFAVVNADVYSEYGYDGLHQAVRSLAATTAPRNGHLVLVDNPAHNPRGDFALADGEVSLAETGRLTFSGIAAYRSEMFSSLVPGEKSPLAPLLRAQARNGKISGEYFDGRWCDVGTPDRLADLDRMLARSTT